MRTPYTVRLLLTNMSSTNKEESKEERRERRKRRKEAEALGENKDPEETKRMRSYSADEKDETGGEDAKRRRTRSMDLASPEEWRNEHSISVVGKFDSGDIPAPFREFSKTPFSDRILQGFQRAGFTAPTAIQAQAWPIALEKRDMISIAKTGSGKTCGFLLPCFHMHLTQQQNKPQQGFAPPMLLVLAPTRELSVQIMEEAQKFGRLLGIRSVCCYGGSPKWPQISAVERGVECVIATPGTFHYERHVQLLTLF